MRRLWIVIVSCAALQLLTPTPAHAWWGWLDEMSGPGPWMFVDGRYRIYCFQDEKIDRNNRNSKDLEANGMRSLNSFDKPVRWLAAIGGVGCVLPSQWGTNPKASLNFSKGFFVAVANNPRPEGEGHLAMVKYEFTGSKFLDSSKIFELNAGGGWLQGRGKSEFTRGYWTVAGNISPYAALDQNSRKHSLLRTITVNVGVIVVPKGFTASDFAAPGPFRTDGEILKTVSITLDFSRY
jgi:hypothetical protein